MHLVGTQLAHHLDEPGARDRAARADAAVMDERDLVVDREQAALGIELHARAFVGARVLAGGDDLADHVVGREQLEEADHHLEHGARPRVDP